jgi:hypothetical protein
LAVSILAVLMAACGAGCPRSLSRYTPAGPPVLPTTASLDDVMRAVNNNSARVQSLYSDDATISSPGMPSLRATVALERPKRLRVRAETAITGTEVDLGSNDQLFWVWMKRMQPPSVLVCRHDQFASSVARQMLPVQPEWLFEALGAATFDPAEQHTGPTPVRGGRLEVRTARQTPDGPQTKITVLDASSAWVLEQHLYDARGTRIASVITSQQWRDPVTGAVVPRQIELQMPASQFSLTLSMKTVQLNGIGASPGPLFDLPSYPNSPVVDLADPRLQGPAAPAASPSTASAPSPYGRPSPYGAPSGYRAAPTRAALPGSRY